MPTTAPPINRGRVAGAFPTLCALFVWGCASPGAPRPPSLFLPAPPRNVTALRKGAEVQVHFSLPTRTTDGLPLRAEPLGGRLCLQAAAESPCRDLPLPPAAAALGIATGRKQGVVDWSVPLPAGLTAGSARGAFLRVEVLNGNGQAAGWSDPVGFAAGMAPLPVAGLTVSGTRRGVLLQWQPVPEGGEVLLIRRQLGPLPAGAGEPTKRAGKPGDLQVLQADPGNQGADITLDAAAPAGVPFRYTAERRRRVQAGGRSLEMRSIASAPVEFTWRDVYPPPAPTDLRAVSFAEPAADPSRPASYAVDLIWQPVDDPRVTGYLVERTPLSAPGAPPGAAEVLTSVPVTVPAFHDATAVQGQAYRYAVTAVDAAANRSAAAVAEVAGR